MSTASVIIMILFLKPSPQTGLEHVDNCKRILQHFKFFIKGQPSNFLSLKSDKLKEDGGQSSGCELNNVGEFKELEAVTVPFENCGQRQRFLQGIQNST